MTVIRWLSRNFICDLCRVLFAALGRIAGAALLCVAVGDVSFFAALGRIAGACLLYVAVGDVCGFCRC